MMTSRSSLLAVASGRTIDLLQPRPDDYADFDWVAEHLAKEARYNGATLGVVYSVAEHMARGALAALEFYGDRQLAAYFAVHDVHEAVLKDDPSPKKRALIELSCELFGSSAWVKAVTDELVRRHDAAIHEAAGLSYPLPDKLQARVAWLDQRMLLTEWRDLMPAADFDMACCYPDLTPLGRKIDPMDWRSAKAMLLEVWREFLPALGGRAS